MLVPKIDNRQSRLFKSETELAAILVPWLTDQEWEVFQEVQLSRGGRVADIVARRDSIIWIIECKLSLGFAVLDQACNWLFYAHYVSLAAPTRHLRSAHICLQTLGIGYLQISRGDVSEISRPRLNRSARADRVCLRDEHKTWAQAGNANRGHFTPFKDTCRNVRNMVTQQPGITMKELIDRVPTHYSSSSTARSALAKWIQRGVVKGVESRRDGRYLRLYPIQEKIVEPLVRSQELIDLAKDVVRSQEARRDEDIKAWAEQLASDVANYVD